MNSMKDETQFLKKGDVVEAITTVYDLPPDKSVIHAVEGNVGVVVHTEPRCWPTVEWANSKTATSVTPEEVRKIKDGGDS